MATCLQRGLSLARGFHRSAFLTTRSFSSDALVEVKPGEIGLISGIPEEHLRRRKWENPLMGWTSTGDPYANVGDAGLSFDSEEATRSFAERHGWQYSVKKPHTPLIKPKSYADNFKWRGPAVSESK